VGPYITEVEEAGNRVIKCNLGEPDFALPKHIREEVKRGIDADLTHYCDPQGILPLREAIARDVGNKRNLKITPDRVVVFPGAKPPIGFCQQTYCDPGDEIVYPSPGFPIYESFIPYIDGTPRPLHLREEAGFAFTGEELEPLITNRTKLVYINFPSNPTGGVATKDQLDGIAQVINKKLPSEARIYSDEVYENILFDGSVHNSIASAPEMAERTIIVSGVSKTYSWTGGRVGWAIFPTAEEAQIFKNLNINYFSCVPAYNQMGAKVAIESPESAVEIERMVKAFQERRDRMLELLLRIPDITCPKPQGAFYLMPDWQAYLGRHCGAWEIQTSIDLAAYFLEEAHVAVVPGVGFRAPEHLRFSYASSIERIEEGMRRVREAAAKLE